MRILLLSSILLAAACGGSAAGGGPPALDGRVRLAADGAAQGTLQVHLQGLTGVASQPGPAVDPTMDADHARTEARLNTGTSDVSFAIERSTLQLQLNGKHGAVTGTSFPLGDLRVFASWLPKEGLVLRHLSLRAVDDARLDVERARADSVTLAGPIEFVLDWELELIDQTLYPLGPLPLGSVDARVGVVRSSDGAVNYQIYGTCADCGGIESVVTLSQGVLFAIVPVTVEAL